MPGQVQCQAAIEIGITVGIKLKGAVTQGYGIDSERVICIQRRQVDAGIAQCAHTQGRIGGKPDPVSSACCGKRPGEILQFRKAKGRAPDISGAMGQVETRLLSVKQTGRYRTSCRYGNRCSQFMAHFQLLQVTIDNQCTAGLLLTGKGCPGDSAIQGKVIGRQAELRCNPVCLIADKSRIDQGPVAIQLQHARYGLQGLSLFA